jgi:ABC-2 type transport system permease protein
MKRLTMDRKLRLIAKREIQMRLHSAMFVGMFLSFVLLVALAPWVIKIEDTSQSQTAGAIDSSTISILFIVYGILISSCTLLSYGLIEEKASAVIDVLVSSVRPETILRGKILGITFLTLVEMTLLSTIGYISSYLKSKESLSISPQFVVLAILFLAPAIVITSFSVASISFRIKKVEEMGILQLPLLLSLAGCLFMGVFTMFSPGSRVSEIGRWIPVASTFVSPILFQKTEISNFGLLLSLLAAGAFAMATVKISTRSFLLQAVR